MSKQQLEIQARLLGEATTLGLMTAANDSRRSRGESPAYDEDEFADLADRVEQIHTEISELP